MGQLLPWEQEIILNKKEWILIMKYASLWAHW